MTQPTENSAKPTDPTPASPRSSKALIKTLLELGPLVLFFAANARPEWFKPLLQWSGLTGMDDVVQTPLFMATAVFMVAMLVSLVLSWVLLRHIAVMPLQVNRLRIMATHIEMGHPSFAIGQAICQTQYNTHSLLQRRFEDRDTGNAKTLPTALCET